VALSEAAVKAKALELGIGTVGKELTEQEKIQARYAIIMEQTTMAQGDFERTSGGLANQMKILKASFKDAADQIGTALLPGVVAVAAALIQVLPTALAFGKEMAGAVKAILEAGWEKFGGLLKDIAGLAWDGLTTFIEKVKELAGVAWGGLISGFTAIKDFASAEIAPRIADIAASIKEIAQASIAHVAPQFDALKSAIAGVSLKDLSDGFQTLKEKIQPAIDVLQPLVERVLAAAKQAVMDVAKELGPLKKAFEDLGKALEPLTPILEPLAKVLGTVLVLAVAALLLALEGFIRFTGTTLKVAIESLVIVIKGITLAIEGVTKVVEEWAPKIGRALGDVAKAVDANVDNIIKFFNKIGLVNLWDIGWDIIAGLAAGMWNAATGVLTDTLGKITSLIPDKKGPPSKDKVLLYPTGRLIIGGLAKGMEDEFNETVGPMLSAFGQEIVTDVMGGAGGRVPWDGTGNPPPGPWYGVGEAAGQSGAGGWGGRGGSAPQQAILGSDGKWYKSEADMPSGVTGASSGGDPNAKTKNGSSTSYIGGGQTAGLPHMPNVGDTFNGMTWNGTAWIQGPSADTGSGSAQHATITIVQNIGSVGSKGEAAMMMQDGAYALATRGL
jgi:hypothetical protein